MKNVTRIVLAAAALAATSAAWAVPGTPPVQVPEPGSLALLAAGVAGAVAALRNRRK